MRGGGTGGLESRICTLHDPILTQHIVNSMFLFMILTVPQYVVVEVGSMNITMLLNLHEPFSKHSRCHLLAT